MPVFSSKKGGEVTNCFQSTSLRNCCLVQEMTAALGRKPPNELLWLQFAGVSEIVQGWTSGEAGGFSGGVCVAEA